MSEWNYSKTYGGIQSRTSVCSEHVWFTTISVKPHGLSNLVKQNVWDWHPHIFDRFLYSPLLVIWESTKIIYQIGLKLFNMDVSSYFSCEKIAKIGSQKNHPRFRERKSLASVQHNWPPRTFSGRFGSWSWNQCGTMPCLPAVWRIFRLCLLEFG